ncbi:MAG: response regulator [Pseudomonadota bacterium]|uniref:response regulator n=1 Tax=Alcanivorax sp. TaxID=1872427 RepID=UPI0025C578B9|nr:response regulator [Alcanivorax sp.]MED5238211.1 response regulator [Pseudomonadota bacterium]MEE3320979.1 response regulator [Pseudomonadota bacterium]
MYQIMLVDDEDYILKALHRTLSMNTDWQVETYQDPHEALRRARTTVFDAVVTDFMMPEMNGVDLLQEIRDLQPDAIRILLTGVIDIETVMSAINKAGAFRFIPKPWEDDQLLDALREGMKFHDILLENRILAQKVREQEKALQSLGLGD